MGRIMEMVRVPGAEALREVAGYRQAFNRTSRLYPFIIGADDEVRKFEQMIDPPADGGAACIELAGQVDVARWLRDKASEYAEDWPDESWPEAHESPTDTIFSLHDLLSGQPKPEVFIGLVEVENSWEVFAKLGLGDWNDCPAPHVHVALHRYWHQRFMAMPIAISGDVVECFVGAPPADKDTALRLAREQYTYCYDIVEQGVGSIGSLGSAVLNSKFWYFWWD